VDDVEMTDENERFWAIVGDVELDKPGYADAQEVIRQQTHPATPEDALVAAYAARQRFFFPHEIEFRCAPGEYDIARRWLRSIFTPPPGHDPATLWSPPKFKSQLSVNTSTEVVLVINDSEHVAPGHVVLLINGTFQQRVRMD
jgi:hypothetical protein